MKLLYCTKCNSVVRLVMTHVRKCECGEVGGKYTDEENAVIRKSAWCISMGIGNGTFYQAITNVTNAPFHMRDEYIGIGKFTGWLRPNSGPGNPHTREVNSFDDIS